MGEGGKVLVADDDKFLVELISVNLEAAGFEVLKAYDGEEALMKALSERPDLVVLDVIMPGKSGWEVLEELRARPETQRTPVILLTVLKGKEHIVKGWERGADFYLPKPFDPEDLVEVVERLIRASKARREVEGNA
ncbi:MAG TPA: response regulator [Armatimonadetes bacterium]|nr:response regulator [Armatimonadota bacterium]